MILKTEVWEGTAIHKFNMVTILTLSPTIYYVKIIAGSLKIMCDQWLQTLSYHKYALPENTVQKLFLTPVLSMVEWFTKAWLHGPFLCKE